MGKKYSTSERLTVLEDMGYEIDMLRGMHQLRPRLRGLVVVDLQLAVAAVWNSNALLEAQCVHVRNLLEFFYTGSDGIRAVSYVQDWNEVHKPDEKDVLGEAAGPLYGDLCHKLSHLNEPRKDKRVWDTLPTITKGLLDTVRLFDTLLDAEESSALRSHAPDIGWSDVDQDDLET